MKTPSYLIYSAVFLFMALPIRAHSSESSEVFKSVDSTGRVTYSNNPNALSSSSKTKMDKAKLPPPSIEGVEAYTPSYTSRSTPAPAGNATAPLADKERIQEAQRKIDQAIKQQKIGEEPLEGERIGTANGNRLRTTLTSRSNETYQSRQDALAASVAEAQQELDELLKKK